MAQGMWSKAVTSTADAKVEFGVVGWAETKIKYVSI